MTAVPNCTQVFSWRGHEDHPLRAAAVQLRIDVFVEEQKVPFILEVDARDYLATTMHIAGVDEDGVVSVERVLEDAPRQYHIGRVAVAAPKRHLGHGRFLIEAAHDKIAESLAEGETATVTLDAQEQALGFYASLGYKETERPRFYDAGIPHREMRRHVTCRR